MEIKPPILKDISPIETLDQEIKRKNPPTGVSSFKPPSIKDINSIGKDKRLNTKEFDISLNEAYGKLNSGEYIRKFDTFVPGTNNEEREAQQQSTGEKWANGMSKLVGKTGTAVIGGTIGTVNGIINGVTEGSLEATYSNGFNEWLDDLNTKMDYNLPNYYTEQEKKQGLFKSMGTANFWANDVTSGLSFTLGTIVSEGIWAYATGGTSLIAKGALGATTRWGAKALSTEKALSAINKYKEVAGKAILRGAEKKAVSQLEKSVVRGVTATRLANNARFLVTSAGYEAGVEARFYEKSTEENWLNSFQELNGRPPSPEEKAAFKKDLEVTANRVFGANVALVGASNLVMFGSILKGSPINQTVKNNFFKNKILGVGYKTVDGKKIALEANRAQKVARGVYSFGKYGALEGFVEEGGQGVLSSTGENFMLDTYKTENIDNSISLMDSVIKGFEESYGTNEGQKAIGIGFIVGLLGGAMATKGRFNDASTEQKEIKDLVNKSNQVTSEFLVNRVKELSRIENATRKESNAIKEGDLTGELTARREAMQIRAIRDIRLGGVEAGMKDLDTYLQKTLEDKKARQELADSIGVDANNEDALNSYVSEIKKEYRNVAEKTQKNLNFAEAILGDSPIAGASKYDVKDLAEGMAYNLTMGEVSDEIADDMVNTIKEIVAKNIGVEAAEALTVENVLRKVDPKNLKELNRLKRTIDLKKQKEVKLQERLFDLQNSSREKNESYTASLAAANKSLLKSQTEIQELQSKREITFLAANIPILSNGEVTVDMLDNQSNNLKLLNDKLSYLNPNDRQNVQTLTKNYENAVRQTKQFNSTVELITNPKTRVNLLNGWLSKLINKNKVLNEGLQKYFQETTDQYTVSQNAQIGALNAPNTIDAPIIEDEVTEQENPLKENVDKLQEEIDEIVKKDSFLKEYIGDDAETELAKKDTDRFSELLRKASINPQTIISSPFKEGRGLTAEETQELKDLNKKLNDWRVIDGSGIGDKLKLIEALQTEVENENTSITTKVSQIVIASQEQEGSGTGSQNVNTVQSPAEKVAKYNYETGNYEISHTNIESLLDLVPGSTITLNGKDISELTPRQRKKPGNKYILKVGDNEINVTVTDYNRLEVNKKELDGVLDPSVKIIDFSVTNFMPLYKDGKPVEGDFGYQNVSGEIVNYNKEAVSDLQKGDVLTTEIDLGDTFNQELLDQYNKGKITKQELANKLVIYVKPKNSPNTIVGSLRSLKDKNEVSDSITALSEIRNEAVEKMLKEGNGKIDLEIEIPIDKVLLGNPNIKVDESGNPKTIPFTSEATNEIIATGYVLDGVISLNKDVQFNPKIAKSVSKKNPGKKVPIVVFKYRNLKVAYPVNLIETTTDLSQAAEDILNTSLSPAQKAEQFVKYLAQNKFDPNSFGIDYADSNWTDTQGVQQALDALAQKKDIADVETWLDPKFNPTNLVQQAQISVDITDSPLMSGKIIIKLEDRIPYDNRIAKQKYKNKIENQRIALVEELSQEAIQLEILFRDSSNLSNDDVDSDFFQAMYDRDIQKNPDTYIKNAQNKSILKEMFEQKIPRAVAKMIGKEKIDSIKQRLDQLEKLEELERSTPNTIEPLTEEETSELTFALSTLPFESTDELLPNLMRAFYTKGEFNPSLSSLTSSGLYNKFEAKQLMDSPEAIKTIRDLILKLQVAEDAVQKNVYFDDRFVSVSTEMNIIGKAKPGNPYVNEKEALELLGGIKDRDTFEQVLNDSDLEYLKESYQKTKDTDQDLFRYFEKYSRVPIKVIKDGNIVDKEDSAREYLEEVLTKPSDDQLMSKVDFLIGLSPIVAEINNETVQTVLDEVLDNTIDIGLDLSQQKGKSIKELRPLLQAIADFTEFGDEQSFNNLVTEYDKVNPTVNKHIKIVNTQVDRGGLIYLETDENEHELYKNHNLVRIDDNLYINTGEQDLEEMYQNLFENKDLIPKKNPIEEGNTVINRQTIEESLQEGITIEELGSKGLKEKEEEAAKNSLFNLVVPKINVKFVTKSNKLKDKVKEEIVSPSGATTTREVSNETIQDRIKQENKELDDIIRCYGG